MHDALSGWTTIGIGGSARRITVARTRGRLTELACDALVLGRGSNVLVSDDGYDGDVVINRCEYFERSGCYVTVGSGTRLGVLCGFLAENGLSGMEWATGIPASVGGAIKMNAGAFGGAMSDVTESAEVLRGGKVIRLSAAEIGFGYRTSVIKSGDTVIGATLRLHSNASEYIRRRMAEYQRSRRLTQPSGKSCGSIFKNTHGVSVGKVLDAAGLKGVRRGGAVISPKHANMIVNVGGATARDVCALIELMRAELEAENIEAKEEIIYIGGF